ncbi:MAG: nitrilase-related carbon-nitrogen hydrolase, partial [Bacteroidota bacterium]|nr:nitrilase-related carbon-nitrogen hydrolase [Bacteroidota bacterium]
MPTTLNIALIQTDLYWEDPKTNRKMFEDKMASVPDDVDLVVLPEMFTTGFTMRPDKIPLSESQETLEWMKKISREHNKALIGSIIFQEDEKHYNRLFFTTPDGDLESYDKKHTFTLAGEDEVYEAGNKKLIFDFKGFKICPLICYDLRFP